MSDENVEPQTGQHSCEDHDCKNVATRRCSACKRAWYCSTTCQKKDWKFHIFDCENKGNIRSAHYLVRACYTGVMPLNSSVLADYGFERLNASHSHCLLLGLYSDLLFHDEKITARVLDTWVKQGTLLQSIKAEFEKRPADERGKHYDWLIHNEWMLDGSPIPAEYAEGSLTKDVQRTLWAFLGPTRKARFKKWSEDRKTCAALYGIILSNYQPSPGCRPQDMYINFGFCAVNLKANQDHTFHQIVIQTL